MVSRGNWQKYLLWEGKGERVGVGKSGGRGVRGKLATQPQMPPNQGRGDRRGMGKHSLLPHPTLGRQQAVWDQLCTVGVDTGDAKPLKQSLLYPHSKT